MANVVLPRSGPPPANAAKSGEGYDRCPADGCIEVERSFKHGGRNGRGELYSNWDMFVADPKKGGCGENWTRTTKQGVERDHRRGVNPKWKTRSAERGTYTEIGTPGYRFNYDCAFLKCGCAFCDAQALLPATERAWCPHCEAGEPLVAHG